MAEEGASGGISIASAAATCPLGSAWVGIQFLITLFHVVFLWGFSPPTPRPEDEGEGLKKKLLQQLGSSQETKRLLEEQVQVECYTGELNPVLYFAK